MEILKEQWIVRLNRCSKGQHKMRENTYGITWCCNCGLIGKGTSEKLNSDDCLKIKN